MLLIVYELRSSSAKYISARNHLSEIKCQKPSLKIKLKDITTGKRKDIIAELRPDLPKGRRRVITIFQAKQQISVTKRNKGKDLLTRHKQR
ncbi:hypothetical protein CEXT_47841 [Caerostris extrusa]|uniref:Uncharacterized protein n=1 Tax=Caerostris extrusa TaxID=172846 RepID=A0AAV4Q127_CAEEX|nr:hypothetical protein CEXT_47841 [Caerostris extrusa]